MSEEDEVDRKHYRYRISLRITHPRLDPREITSTLRIKPKWTWCVGEPRKTMAGTLLSGTYPHSYWYVGLRDGEYSDKSLVDVIGPCIDVVDADDPDALAVSLQRDRLVPQDLHSVPGADVHSRKLPESSTVRGAQCCCWGCSPVSPRMPTRFERSCERLVFLPSEPFKPRVPCPPTSFAASRAVSANSIIRPEMSCLLQPTSRFHPVRSLVSKRS